LRGPSADAPLIDNEVHFSDKTWMVFGDAKAVIEELVKQLSGGSGMH
jgi:NAD/NADP transhydrogenase beta subunit